MSTAEGRKIEMTLRDFDALYEAIGQAALVGASETESQDPKRSGQVKKFKYVCGKNWKKMKAVIADHQREMAKIFAPDAQFSEYQEEREDILREHAKRLEDGSVEMDTSSPDGAQYIHTKEGRKAANAAMAILDKKYSATLKRAEKKRIKANAQLEKMVRFTLHAFDVGGEDMPNLPEKLAGGYIDAIEPMLAGMPKV